MSHTYYTPADIAALLPETARRQAAGNWRAACPVHASDNPTSLLISQGQGKTLLHCFAHQCSAEEICQSLGLTVANLFVDAPSLDTLTSRPAPAPPVFDRALAASLGEETPATSEDIQLMHLMNSLHEQEDLALLDIPEVRVLLAKAIAQPALRPVIERRLRQAGFHPPSVFALVQGAYQPTPQPHLTDMHTVQTQPIQWLWWPYLALGTLAMLDGDPGIGKSMLTLQLAAALSTGAPLPDQQGQCDGHTSPPADTLFFAREDSLSHVVRPRLEALHADLTRIHYCEGITSVDGELRPFTLADVPLLNDTLHALHPRLLVLDPIQAYLGPKIDMHRANETRPLLDILSRLAEQHQCTILCVRHPAKASGQGGGKAMLRGLGSVDFIGAARTGLFVEQHLLDPTLAMVALSKSNLGPKARTQIFSKAEGRFQWAGITRLDAELLAGNGRGPDPRAFLEAYLWLERRLEGGIPVPANDLEQQGEEEQDIAPRTLRRAKKTLGVQSVKNMEVWCWKLPSLEIFSPTVSGQYDLHDPLVPHGLLGHVPLKEEERSTIHGQYDLHDPLVPHGTLGHLQSLQQVTPTVREGGPITEKDIEDQDGQVGHSAYAHAGARRLAHAHVAQSVPVCGHCGAQHWQTGMTPPRCLACGARATIEG